MVKKLTLFFVLICFLAFSSMIFKTVPIPDDISECLKTEGKIIDIIDAGTYDIRFVLEADDSIYYINRGLQRGLVLEDLRKRLIGEKATFYYPEHWSPLDLRNTSHHLNQVDVEGEIIFTEIGTLN